MLQTSDSKTSASGILFLVALLTHHVNFFQKFYFPYPLTICLLLAAILISGIRRQFIILLIALVWSLVIVWLTQIISGFEGRLSPVVYLLVSIMCGFGFLTLHSRKPLLVSPKLLDTILICFFLIGLLEVSSDYFYAYWQDIASILYVSHYQNVVRDIDIYWGLRPLGLSQEPSYFARTIVVLIGLRLYNCEKVNYVLFHCLSLLFFLLIRSPILALLNVLLILHYCYFYKVRVSVLITYAPLALFLLCIFAMLQYDRLISVFSGQELSAWLRLMFPLYVFWDSSFLVKLVGVGLSNVADFSLNSGLKLGEFLNMNVDYILRYRQNHGFSSNAFLNSLIGLGLVFNAFLFFSITKALQLVGSRNKFFVLFILVLFGLAFGSVNQIGFWLSITVTTLALFHPAHLGMRARDSIR